MSGFDLSTTVQDRFNLEWLLWAPTNFPTKHLLQAALAYLAGNDRLERKSKRENCKRNKESWGKGLEEYNRMREKYLLYRLDRRSFIFSTMANAAGQMATFFAVISAI